MVRIVPADDNVDRGDACSDTSGAAATHAKDAKYRLMYRLPSFLNTRPVNRKPIRPTDLPTKVRYLSPNHACPPHPNYLPNPNPSA